MLVVEPGRLADRIVGDLPALLRAEDVLVFNDTRVIPAQLDGARGEARIGATLTKRAAPRRWWAFVRNAKRVRIGDGIDVGRSEERRGGKECESTGRSRGSQTHVRKKKTRTDMSA